MPQQRRAQATRHAIVVAAAEEFDQVGYDATPLSAILRRSGVTKGAFYFHFRSKEAVAGTLVQHQWTRWLRLRERWSGVDLDPLSSAVGITREATRLLEQDVIIRAGVGLAGRRFDSVGQPAAADWENFLAGLFRRAAASGHLSAGVDATALARTLHAALVGARVSARRQEQRLAERVTEIWNVLLDGFASAEWLRTHRDHTHH